MVCSELVVKKELDVKRTSLLKHFVFMFCFVLFFYLFIFLYIHLYIYKHFDFCHKNK